MSNIIIVKTNVLELLFSSNIKTENKCISIPSFCYVIESWEKKHIKFFNYEIMGRSFKSKFLLAPHNYTHHSYRILKLRRYIETSLYSCPNITALQWITICGHNRSSITAVTTSIKAGCSIVQASLSLSIERANWARDVAQVKSDPARFDYAKHVFRGIHRVVRIQPQAHCAPIVENN